MIDKLKSIVVFDYATKKRPIDEDFYKKIVAVCSKHYKIEEYVKKIKFESIDKENATAMYGKNLIKFDMDKMEKQLECMRSILPSDFYIAEKEAFSYLEAARIVFHEIMHAVQIKDLDERRIEDVPDGRRAITEVNPYFFGNIKYSMKRNGEEKAREELKKWNKLVGRKYGYDIVRERDAEIQSYSLIYTMLEGLDNVFSHTRKYMYANLQQAATMGYCTNENGNVISPLYDYAKVLTKNDMLDAKNLSWYDEDEKEALRKTCLAIPKLSDRLKLGMPISQEEYLGLKRAYNKYLRERYIVCSYGPIENPCDPNL